LSNLHWGFFHHIAPGKKWAKEWQQVMKFLPRKLQIKKKILDGIAKLWKKTKL